jgi:elongation factor G
MASPDLSTIRNIGIIAHIDAGKTTVTERMLFASGAKHRAGEVDRGTTTTDDDAEEAERGITIYSACVCFPWKVAAKSEVPYKQVDINLIDTPGHVDFTAEVERSLRVLDGAVIVFSAREGVEAQSETVWRQADKYHVPRLAFINKLDREGANFDTLVDEIRDRLGARPVPLQIPMGLGPAHVANPFRGIIDLVRQKALTFPEGKEGRQVVEAAIPDDYADEAALWREHMLESLYNFSNELMELALSEEPIPEALIHRVVRDATVHQQIQPILCGSALHGIGVQPLLDAVAAYLPNPLEMPPVEGVDPSHKGHGKSKKHAAEEGKELPKIRRKPDPKEPFCGLVFKVLPFKTGDLAWVRIYSGTLEGNSRVLNPGRDKKENVAQLWRIHASKKEEQLDQAQAGDIVGVIGLRDSVTGDTICDTRAPILLESIDFPETVISMAIEPESTADKKKLADVLDMLRKQDPTFAAAENEETGQTLISGMGELHLEVIQHRLQRDFKLNVKVHQPRVSYRESIARAAEVDGDVHRIINGVAHTAKLKLRVEPMPTAAGVVVGSVPNAGLPGDMLAVVLEELENAGQGGGVLGFPLMRVKATLLSGQMHETESTEVAFRMAASAAFDAALRAAGTVLLEPIMRLEISTPDEHVGDLVGDLQQRRAIINQTQNRGHLTVLHAEAPLAELFGYSSAMRSLSQGRASCSMEPSTYAAAPDEVLKRFL